MYVGARDRQRNRPFEAVRAMAEDPVKTVMTEVIDRGFDRRVLLARRAKVRRRLAVLIGLAQPAFAGQRIQIKHLVEPGSVVRAVEAAVETAHPQVRKQGLCRRDHRHRSTSLPSHIMS